MSGPNTMRFVVGMVVGMNELLRKVAERLCDCRGRGDRPGDIMQHQLECEYRKTIEGQA